MKKSLIFVGMLAVGYANAQETNGRVGVNTDVPKATLDVKSISSDAAKGILTPQMTGDELQTMTANLTADQNGLIVFVTSGVTTPDTSTNNVQFAGYHRFNISGTEKSWTRLEPSGLEKIKGDGANIGWRLIGKEIGRYSSIGGSAVDLSNIRTGEDVGKSFGASGSNSVAMNYGTLASGFASVAIGYKTISSGTHSFSSGSQTQATNSNSVAIGQQTKSINTNSFSGGYQSVASGNNSFAFGEKVTASGAMSFAGGNGTTASGSQSMAFGTQSSVFANNSLVIGNSSTIASGNNSVAFGDSNTVNGSGALVSGSNNTISAALGTAFGYSNEVTSYAATAVGFDNSATGVQSFVGGSRSFSSGENSFVYGGFLNARGSNSAALGFNNIVEGNSSLGIGVFGTIDTVGGEGDNRRLFTVGNGWSVNNRSDAFAVLRNGIVGIDIDNLETTTQSAKLQVNGEILSSSLAGVGNRAVYADENGVLKVGNAYATNTTNSLWTRDEATNTIKLAVNSDGTDRTNAVTIDNAGAVYASSLKGYNGASIFPDYVFQKYYTGNSSIKADYTFKSLSQVEDFVKTNGHLPGYKSAAAIKAQGYVDLMETQLTNVEKIEELYLHSIEQEKNLKELRKENEELKARLEKLEKLLK